MIEKSKYEHLSGVPLRPELVKELNRVFLPDRIANNPSGNASQIIDID